MNALKRKNMMKAYTGHNGTETVSHILEIMGNELNHLSGKDLGKIMNAIDKAYRLGKTSSRAEMIDTNVVWIENLQKAIEWKEVGAEYQEVTEDAGMGMGITKTYNKKVKDGELVLSFSE
jgi:hypothetical protein